MSRIERLINLTAALLNTERPLSADQIRERVPGYPDEKLAFRRQFERDKEALRELGLPLTTSELTGEFVDAQFGYRITREEYYLRDPGLDPDELSALHLAARMVQMDGMNASDGVWKLGVSEEVQTSPSDVAVSLPASEALATLFAAIAGGNSVRFGYRENPRSVQPSRLSFRNGHWYLVGFDQGRDEQRSFRVDRIEGTVQTADPIAAPVPSQTDIRVFSRPWEIGDGDAIRTLVRIDADQASWAQSYLGPESVDSVGDDGSIVFAFDVRNIDAFRSFVIGFLDHSVVESPEAMRNVIVDWLVA